MVQRVLLFSRYVGYGSVTAITACAYHAYHTIDDCSSQLKAEIKEIDARRAELEELEKVYLTKKRRSGTATTPNTAASA